MGEFDISKQFEGFGKSIKENMPRLKVGDKKKSKPTKYSPWVENFKKWALIFLSLFVAGVAGLMIAIKLIGRLI